MSDRDLIESELLTIKGVCDLYMHGTTESTTAEVHQAFQSALEESFGSIIGLKSTSKESVSTIFNDFAKSSSSLSLR